MARKMWESSNFARLVVEAPASCFAMKVLWFSSKVSVTELRSILAMAWAIWYGFTEINWFMSKLI